MMTQLRGGEAGDTVHELVIGGGKKGKKEVLAITP